MQVSGFHKGSWGILSSHLFYLLLLHFSALIPRWQANYSSTSPNPTQFGALGCEHCLWRPVWERATLKSADSCAAHQNHSGMLGMCIQPCERRDKRGGVTSFRSGLFPSITDRASRKSKLFLCLPTQTCLAGVISYFLVELQDRKSYSSSKSQTMRKSHLNCESILALVSRRF